MRQPLVIDLFCGLGGWSEGFLAAGWRAVGFDIERHVYGDLRYPGELVLQDVLTLDGAQFRDADLIVASPPCQKYSWLAMPWSRSASEHSQACKALRRKWETEGPDNALFSACFRIQQEAMLAAGRYVPLVVENVRGAQEWVGIDGPCAHIPVKERWRRGRSRWNHGSFHLWGDVPALMPVPTRIRKSPSPAIGRDWSQREVPRLNDGAEGGRNRAAHEWDDGPKAGCGGSWFRERNGQPQPGIPHEERGLKVGGDWFRDSACHSKFFSKSDARKMASAKIAKIPPAISEHFAEVFRPRPEDSMQLNADCETKHGCALRGSPSCADRSRTTDGENRTYLSDSCCKGPHANLRDDTAVSHPDLIHPG